MDMKIIKKEDKEVVIEFDTADLTIPDLLADALLKESDVSFAGVNKSHIESKTSKLTLKTKKKKAADVLAKTIDGLEDEFTNIKKSIK